MTQSKIQENYRYSKDHEWVARDEKDDRIVAVGISDHAAHALGDIVHVELPAIGENFGVGDELGVIESAKSASEIYSPVSGEIVEVNDLLDANPELINDSPYENGWIVKIRLSDPDELSKLLNSEGYRNLLSEEE